MVGLALALQLASQRLRVGLVAHDQPRPGDVRAYALNPASRDQLAALRVWPQGDAATPVHAMEVHGDDGGELRFDAAGTGRDALAWIVDVPALEHQLAQAVSYQSLIDRIPAADAEQAKALAASAPLTVICEGRDSFSRERLGVAVERHAYGQHAIAARLSCEKPHGHVARQWFDGGEILALLPLAGNSVALVWSVADAHHAELMALNTESFVERLHAACRGALGTLTLTSERAAWPLTLGQARHWVGPRWALAGDAAHTLHPLAGQGLNVGLADVAELARVLQARQGQDYWRELGDVKLLRRYERARKADVAAMTGLTDGLQRLFVQAPRGWQVLRNAGMNVFEHSGPLKQWVARQAMGL